MPCTGRVDMWICIDDAVNPVLSFSFLGLQAFDTPENLLKDHEGYFYKQLTEENSGIDS